MTGRYAVMLCQTDEYPRLIIADTAEGEVWAQVDGKGLIDAMAAGKGRWLADMPPVGAIPIPYPEQLVCMAPMSWLRDFCPPDQRTNFDLFKATCIQTAREASGVTLQ
jgi:hypothetical protein